MKGEIHIDADDELFKTMLDQDQSEVKTRTLKLRGDVVYVPKIRVHSFERSQSIPEITFRAEFHGASQHGNSFVQVQDNEEEIPAIDQGHSEAKSSNVHRVLPIGTDYPRVYKETAAYVPDFSKSRNYSDNSDDSPKGSRTRRLPLQSRSHREVYPEYVDSNPDYRRRHW